MIIPEPQLPAHVSAQALLPGNLVCKNPFVRAGERLSLDKIVGGQDATRGAWKWLVRFHKINCGGTILHKNFVVTAGHCCHAVSKFNNPLELLSFTVNEFDTSRFENVEKIFTPVEFFLHEQYNPDTIENDICMVRVDNDIDLENPDTAPACIGDRDPPPGFKCFVAGWGMTEEKGKFANILQEIQVAVLKTSLCNQPQIYNGQVDEKSMFCAGNLKGGFDSCQGDSGGPLICVSSDRQPFLLGMTSWGFGCARPNAPGVYTRMTSFETWMKAKISGNTSIDFAATPAMQTTAGTTTSTTTTTQLTTTTMPALFPGGTCQRIRFNPLIDFSLEEGVSQLDEARYQPLLNAFSDSRFKVYKPIPVGFSNRKRRMASSSASDTFDPNNVGGNSKFQFPFAKLPALGGASGSRPLPVGFNAESKPETEKVAVAARPVPSGLLGSRPAPVGFDYESTAEKEAKVTGPLFGGSNGPLASRPVPAGFDYESSAQNEAKATGPVYFGSRPSPVGFSPESESMTESKSKFEMESEENQKDGDRIVGGSVVDLSRIDEWGFLVHLDRVGCGGTIVSKHFVMTAAHCCQAITNSVSDRTVQLLLARVMINRHDRTKTGGVQAIPNEIFFHPEWEKATLKNDFCLLRFSEDLTMKSKSSTCLPERGVEPEAGQQCYVAGWGMLAEGGEASEGK